MQPLGVEDPRIWRMAASASAVEAGPFKLRRRALAVALAAGLALAGATGSAVAAESTPEPPLETMDDAEALQWAAIVRSANEQWLRDMYEVILKRTADTGGVDYWLGRLPAGGDAAREAVARRFLFSPEGARGEVDLAYQELLGRFPDPGGREFWTSFLQVHPVTVLRSNLLASNERFSAAGSATNWINEVYQALLERNADTGGRDYWIGRLAGGTPRYTIVASIYHSPEGLGFRVDSLYQQVLGRAPTGAERQAGAVVIRTLNERRLRGQLLASDEYYEQFLAPLAATFLADLRTG